jgi:hypothetical protein
MGDATRIELEDLHFTSQDLGYLLEAHYPSNQDRDLFPTLADRVREISTELMRRFRLPLTGDLDLREKVFAVEKELDLLVSVIGELQQGRYDRLEDDLETLEFIRDVHSELEHYSKELYQRSNQDWHRLEEAADRYTMTVGEITSVASLPAGLGILAKLGPAYPRIHLEEPPEVISVAVYLDTENSKVQQQVLQAVDELVFVMGYDEPTDHSVEYGSIFRTSWARIKKVGRSAGMRDRLMKVERAIELAGLDVRQAEVDVMATQAVQNLLVALADVPSACVRLGSILLVKHSAPTGQIILARSLSQLEIRTLERFPEIQRQPDKVFEALAVAISTNAIEADDGEPGYPPT